MVGDRARACWWVLSVALVGVARAGGDACDPLVVHEWGTFTSMQGSDGIALEGLQREEEGLPPFVQSRSEVRDGQDGQGRLPARFDLGEREAWRRRCAEHWPGAW